MNELELDDFLLQNTDESEFDKKKDKKDEIININFNDGLIERIDKKCVTSCGKELLND